MIGLLLGVLGQSTDAGLLWPSGLSPFCWYDAVQTNQAVVSQWDDISGNLRHMELTNFSGSTSDGWNTSPDFLQTDGIDSYGRTEETNINDALTDFSWVAAFKVSADTTDGWVYNFCNGSSDPSTGIYYVSQSARYTVDAYDVSGTDMYIYVDTTETNWHIFGFSYSQSTKVATIYLDGVAVGNITALATGLDVITRHSIGERFYGGAKKTSIGFSGCFSGTALTAQQHEDIYNANCLRFGLSQI